MENKQKNRIEALMVALNITQGEFADKVGVKTNAVTNWKARGITNHTFAKIITAFPQVNPEWLRTGIGDVLIEQSDVKRKPHIPTTAAAGSLSGFSDSVSSGDCEMMPVVEALPQYDYTMTIKGNSMEPKFESGDTIAIRKVNDFIEWGKVYVLDTADGAIVKRLYDEGNDFRCVSYNSEYPDFLVSKALVFGIYKVVGLIRI